MRSQHFLRRLIKRVRDATCTAHDICPPPGLLQDVAAEKQRITTLEKECMELEAEYARVMKQKEVQLCSRALTEEAILENRAWYSLIYYVISS